MDIAFRLVDTDRSGTISQAEFARIWRHFNKIYAHTADLEPPNLKCFEGGNEVLEVGFYYPGDHTVAGGVGSVPKRGIGSWGIAPTITEGYFSDARGLEQFRNF